MKWMRLLCILGLLWLFPSTALAIEAYFDTEISTKLEAKRDTGTLVIKMIDEDVPPVFTEVIYQRTLYAEIIFDASRTMSEPDMNGIRKIDIAKKLASILVKNLPQRDTSFALRVNGAQSSNNCLDSELMIPFSRGNAQQVLDMIAKIEPKGLSPLSYSIRRLLQDFTGTKGTKVVFIVTDGLENCDIEPVDACTVTMDMLLQAEFDGSLNILGVNTVYNDAKNLLSCITMRGRGLFLDSNRNSGSELAGLIQNSMQLSYTISKILDPETLVEGKILELRNRHLGDSSTLEGDRVILDSKRRGAMSSHELKPGIYKLELQTVPVLVSYFTIDREQQLTIGIVRSGEGLDLYDRAYLALGNKYYDNGQYNEALAQYQKVLVVDTRNVDAHLNLGILYQDILNDKEKAAEHYKTYLELAGPRQEEVSKWLREVRGLPSEEEELAKQRKEVDELKKRAEAERLAKAEEDKRRKERQKAIDTYNEIRTANPNIVELDQETIISGSETINMTVSAMTPDSKARAIALDAGRRLNAQLARSPEIIIARQNKPDVPIVRAKYDDAQKQYIIIE